MDPSFGPYEVNVATYNVILKDGCKLSTKFWFPGPDKPLDTVEWIKYCDLKSDSDCTEVIRVYIKNSKTNPISF